jgi:hypothetical protein
MLREAMEGAAEIAPSGQGEMEGMEETVLQARAAMEATVVTANMVLEETAAMVEMALPEEGKEVLAGWDLKETVKMVKTETLDKRDSKI